MQHELVHRGRRGFTLAEVMISMAIFTMLIAATVSSQIFGLKMYRISDAKLTVTADARRVLDHVRNEIWTAKVLYVGNGDDTSFTLIPPNTPHIGNALKIQPTTDTNNYVFYFRDPADSCVKRTVNGGDAEIIARNVTNEFIFEAEDFNGNTVVNYQNNRVIKMALQIRQRQWSAATSEYFQLQTRIARRAIE